MTVVITGASAGVGRATVRAFARKGADVGLLARGEDGLEAAKREVEQEGGRAVAIPTDVANAGEVEAALLEHPAVAEAAVTGEPDDRLGERIVAWVVLRPTPSAPTPTAGELEDHVASLLAPHKRPRDVRFIDALPRNEMGKVKKAELTPP